MQNVNLLFPPSCVGHYFVCAHVCVCVCVCVCMCVSVALLQGSGGSIYSPTWWCIYLPVMVVVLEQHRSTRHLVNRAPKIRWRCFSGIYVFYLTSTNRTDTLIITNFPICAVTVCNCSPKDFVFSCGFSFQFYSKYVTVCWVATAVKMLLSAQQHCSWVDTVWTLTEYCICCSADVLLLLFFPFPSWINADKLQCKLSSRQM